MNRYSMQNSRCSLDAADTELQDSSSMQLNAIVDIELIHEHLNWLSAAFVNLFGKAIASIQK